MLSAPTQQQQQLDDGATRRTLALASRRLRHSVAGSAPTSPELGRKRKMGNKGAYVCLSRDTIIWSLVNSIRRHIRNSFYRLFYRIISNFHYRLLHIYIPSDQRVCRPQRWRGQRRRRRLQPPAQLWLIGQSVVRAVLQRRGGGGRVRAHQSARVLRRGKGEKDVSACT